MPPTVGVKSTTSGTPFISSNRDSVEGLTEVFTPVRSKVSDAKFDATVVLNVSEVFPVTVAFAQKTNSLQELEESQRPSVHVTCLNESPSVSPIDSWAFPQLLSLLTQPMSTSIVLPFTTYVESQDH
jgi:hypothetical protein